jgi:hypothetical protein
MASNDPEFEEKAADIIGFYLKPQKLGRSSERRRKLRRIRSNGLPETKTLQVSPSVMSTTTPEIATS